MASMGSRVFVLGGLGGESLGNTAKPEDPTVIHVLDTSASVYHCFIYACKLISLPPSEHIKYPDSNKPPPSGPPTSRKSAVGAAQPPTPGYPINGVRSMSPEQLGSDADEARRAISPSSVRARTPNGSAQPQPLSSVAKGKAPVRPKREDEDGVDRDSSPEMSSAEQAARALSPEQSRAKSPVQSASRATSPVAPGDGQEPISMANVAMGRNGIAARSPSPNVDRSRPPLDGFYNAKPGSPLPNGFAHKPGSTGNLTADLIRDLKEKEAEMEIMKKREAWMKAALSKASRSGFIYKESEEELESKADDDDIDGRKVTEMVINFKQLKARVQVSTVRVQDDLGLFLITYCRPISPHKLEKPRIAFIKLSSYDRVRCKKRLSIERN